jgi:uncharacterized integral membrane protein
MRVIHATVLLVFAAAVVVFCIQNPRTVTVDYLGWGVELPLPVLVLLIYLIGMISGWVVLSYLRRSIHKITEAQN